MNDEQLLRHLKTIGKSFFIRYFELIDDNRISSRSLVRRIVELEKYNENWAQLRVDYSRRIIQEGRKNDALKNISQSRLGQEITDKALNLLNHNTLSLSLRLPDSLPQRPPTPIPVVVAEPVIIDENVLGYIRKATVSEILALYATALDELRERGIVRGANGPGGDYAELLFVQAFGWKREGNSSAGYDAVDTATNMRYQVKSRRLHDLKTSRQLSALRKLPDSSFDFLAGVLFNKDYSVMRAAIIPYDIIKSRARFQEYTNSWTFLLDDRIWNLPSVRDVTQQLRSAATNLDTRP